MKHDEPPEDLDLFEYPAASTGEKFHRPRTLMTWVLLSALPVAVVVLILILLIDHSLAPLFKTTTMHPPQGLGLFLFLASDFFIFTSLVLTFLLNWFVHHNRLLQKQILFVFAASFLSSFLGQVLQFIFGRYSPSALYEKGLYGFAFLQLPPGEASLPAIPVMLATALLLSIHLLYPRFGKAYLVAVLFIALDCLLVGVGFLSDVIAGTYLAILITLLTRRVYERFLGQI